MKNKMYHILVDALKSSKTLGRIFQGREKNVKTNHLMVKVEFIWYRMVVDHVLMYER